MSVIMMHLRAVPAIFHIVFGVPNIVLMNMMASRVFRRRRLVRYKQSLIENSTILCSQLGGHGNANEPPGRTAPIPLVSVQTRNGDEESKMNHSTIPIEVAIVIEAQKERHLDEKPEYSGGQELV